MGGFVGLITTPEQSLVEPDAVSAATPFEPERFAIRASPVQPGSVPVAGDVGSEVRDWPIAEVSLTDASGCLELQGEQGQRFAEVLADANTLTRFRDADVVYDLDVRPLLPHEGDCDAVAR